MFEQNNVGVILENPCAKAVQQLTPQSESVNRFLAAAEKVSSALDGKSCSWYVGCQENALAVLNIYCLTSLTEMLI